jgi:hypothetical protein
MATENSEATVTTESIAIPESIASSIQESSENPKDATENPEEATESRTSLDVLLDVTARPTLYHLNVSLVCLLTAPPTDLLRLPNPNASSGS